MLTQKEITFLNFLYKKFRGEKPEQLEVQKFIEDRIKLNVELAFELSYLYVNNFEEANGDFSNVTEPKRESYEDYIDSVPTNVKIMMEFLNEKDPKSFSEDGYGNVTYLGDGIEYKIYDSINELMDIAIDGADWICDDPEEWAESYIYMSEDQRSSFADEQADSYFDDLDDDEIIDRASIEENLDELEEQKNELQSLKSQLGELESKLENIDSEEEKESVEYDIEEIKSKMEDIGSEERVDEKKQEMIDDARENLKSDYRDEIYNELENPVEYFVGNGFYNSVRQLVRSGPVEFDCDSAKNDYFDNADYETIINSAGYDHYDTIIYERREYYIVWD